MWAHQTNVPDRKSATLRPILRPGAPRLSGVWSSAAVSGWAALVLSSVIVFAIFAVIGAATLGAVPAAATVVAEIAGAGALYRLASRDVVSGQRALFQGRRIDGQGLQLLEDIDARFAYAERNVKQLPTGISWPEVDEDVRALLWEAAEHAADLTALDAEIHEMRYAEPGTPQSALKGSLEQQRKAHEDILRAVQWEAETLARTAGNAVAAARVALARTGSLAALQRITPSRRAIVAAGALAEARQRLELLASVWAELDESGAIAAEQLEVEQRKQLGEGSS